MSKTKSKKEVQVFEYQGKRITFDFGNGDEMVNATEIAKAFNKRLRDFTRLKQTKNFINELETLMNTAEGADVRRRQKAIKRVVGGNRKDLQGTWYEQRLALKLAAWLNPDFELWVYGVWQDKRTFSQWSNFYRVRRQCDFQKKELKFYLNKIFDNTLEANQLTKFLLDKKQLPKKED